MTKVSLGSKIRIHVKTSLKIVTMTNMSFAEVVRYYHIIIGLDLDTPIIEFD